ncbi:MAG: carbohydrate kinase family protein [Methanophagales archaeon]|nr:carbohydrate kinase family protein [Methanophagales archaeon]
MQKTRYEYDVLVIGDVFCDIATKPIRAYPERDKQIGCEFMLSIGGQAGNCAAACASLGLRTAIICKLSNDVLSNWLLSELERLGVVCIAAISERKPHPGITVSIAFEDGSRSMLTDRGANQDLMQEDVEAELLGRARFVMRAGHWNTEGLFTVNKDLLRIAKSHDAFTGVDIGWSAYLGWTASAKQTVFELLPFTDFLFVNEAELKELSAEQWQEQEQKQERDILARGCRNVIIHRGAKGSSWISSDFTVSSHSFKVNVVSPTGAGDVFNAGFIYAFLDGKGAEECLEFANACAALHISRTRSRNAFPRLDELELQLQGLNKQNPLSL